MTNKTQQEEFLQPKKSLGKIYKGTLNDAPMKVKVASIPSKFQNIIYRNHKNPAFGNSRQRFYSQVQNQKNYQPGPGQYLNFNKTSDKIFSKKGFGSMISNTKLQRLQKNYTGLPGPGSYDPNSKIISRMKKSTSLALLSSKIQGHDLFKLQMQHAKKIPGPGIYQTRLPRTNSQTHAFPNDANRFSNKQTNSIYVNDEQTPGVGYYRYQFSSLHPLKNSLNKFSNKVNIAYQKNISQINKLNQKQKLKVVRQIIMNKTKNNENNQIGPGSYNTNKNILDKMISFKIHQTSFDRFGQSIKKKLKLQNNLTQRNNINQQLNDDANNQQIPQKLNKSPTKNYNYTDSSQKKSKISKTLTSMFKSNIVRYNFVQNNVNDPCKYSPGKMDKKSHLINFQNKWV